MKYEITEVSDYDGIRLRTTLRWDKCLLYWRLRCESGYWYSSYVSEDHKECLDKMSEMKLNVFDSVMGV